MSRRDIFGAPIFVAPTANIAITTYAKREWFDRDDDLSAIGFITSSRRAKRHEQRSISIYRFPGERLIRETSVSERNGTPFARRAFLSAVRKRDPFSPLVFARKCLAPFTPRVRSRGPRAPWKVLLLPGGYRRQLVDIKDPRARGRIGGKISLIRLLVCTRRHPKYAPIRAEYRALLRQA
jgi:hypothetical protein